MGFPCSNNSINSISSESRSTGRRSPTTGPDGNCKTEITASAAITEREGAEARIRRHDRVRLAALRSHFGGRVLHAIRAADIADFVAALKRPSRPRVHRTNAVPSRHSRPNPARARRQPASSARDAFVFGNAVGEPIQFPSLLGSRQSCSTRP